MRLWVKRTLLYGLGIPALLLLGLLLYLTFGDLSGLCGLAEGAVTDALGRELRIAGRCQPELWSPARVVIEDVTLAGPGWGSEPVMVEAERLAVSLDLWSVLDGPIRVHDLQLQGARVLLERDVEGRANWEFSSVKEEAPEPPEDEDKGIALIAEQVVISDIQVEYRDAAAAVRHFLRVDRLSLSLDADDVMRLEAAGALDDLTLGISGSLGTQAELLRAGAVSAHLEARVAETEVTLNGSFADLASLRQPKLEVTLEGSDIVAVTEILETPALGDGPFHITAGLTGESLDAESEVMVEAHLGEVEARAQGRIGSVLDPRRLALDVAASGPNLAAIGALAGTDVLPAEPFELSGAVEWDERSLVVDGLRARIGESSLEADGELALQGTDRELSMGLSFQGPDLSALVQLPDLGLPAAPFSGSGRFVGSESGAVVESLRLAVGETTLEASGALGAQPGFDRTTLDVELVSDDLPLFDSLAGFALPGGTARLAGRVAYMGGRIDLEGLRATLGPHELAADGSLGLAEGLVGTDLRVEVRGPSLADVVGQVPLDVPALPEEPYDVAGRIAVTADGYQLEGVEVRAGELQLAATGRVGSLPSLDGTEVEIHAEGPRLADLGAWGELPPLPSEAFVVGAGVQVSDGVYRVVDGVVTLGDERLTLDGSIGPFPDLLSTDACVELGGPDIRRVREYLLETELVDRDAIPEPPSQEYNVSGCVQVVETGYAVRDGRVTLGQIEASLDGIVSAHPKLIGSDVTLTVRGPDAVDLAAMVGLELPFEPFEIDGQIERTDSGFRAVTLQASLGDMRLEADGLVGSPPELEGSDVSLRLTGERTRLLADFLNVELPAIEFDIAATLRGSMSQVSAEDIEAEIGGSDLRGAVRADLGDKLNIEVDLRSQLLDIGGVVRPLLEAEAKAEDQEASVNEPAPVTAGADEEVAADGELLIPDDRLGFDALRSLDASIRYEAEVVRAAVDEVRDVVLAAELRDGALRLLPTSITGPTGSRLSAQLTLLPLERGYALDARISADRLELLGAFTEGVEQVPTVDFDLDLQGAGTTPHALVSAADGVLIVTVNPGYLEGRMLDFLGGGLVTQMLGAVNPFSKQENTHIECVVALGELQAGLMTLDPVILRTVKMDFVGDGQIDFETEEFDLGWTIKNRKGFGLSLAMFTDSSFQLGGTLANPRLEITPLEFAVERTKAVATAGVWPVLKRFWNRITAGKDRCGKALEEARAVRSEFRRSRAVEPAGGSSSEGS